MYAPKRMKLPSVLRRLQRLVQPFWRKHLGWMPVQFCMECGKAHWAGFPSFGLEPKQFFDGSEDNVVICTWLPWWKDYCSKQCAEKAVNYE